MKNNPLPRLDTSEEVRQRILPFCRLHSGEAWVDPKGQHKVACVDAADTNAVLELMDGEKADLAIHDPPYNLVAFEERELNEYIRWCKRWVRNSIAALKPDSSFYVWLGADQRNGFQPLPDFMIMMRETALRPRSFITMRNQRGYGTQKNWMAGQHRGNVGEGQLHLKHDNVVEFSRFEVRSNELAAAIRNAHQRQFQKAK